MSHREKILSALEESPMSFSELKEKTGLANGVIQHHINASEKIKKENGALILKGKCDSCDLREECCNDCIILKINDERKRDILKLKDEGLTQSEIAEKLELSRPTVNHHFQDLRLNGLIKDGEVRENISEALKE
ncbi:MAG: ArsR family transcriptional regulator [Candidatus Nanohaloarchaea archaeon]